MFDALKIKTNVVFLRIIIIHARSTDVRSKNFFSLLYFWGDMVPGPNREPKIADASSTARRYACSQLRLKGHDAC